MNTITYCVHAINLKEKEFHVLINMQSQIYQTHMEVLIIMMYLFVGGIYSFNLVGEMNLRQNMQKNLPRAWNYSKIMTAKVFA